MLLSSGRALLLLVSTFSQGSSTQQNNVRTTSTEWWAITVQTLNSTQKLVENRKKEENVHKIIETGHQTQTGSGASEPTENWVASHNNAQSRYQKQRQNEFNAIDVGKSVVRVQEITRALGQNYIKEHKFCAKRHCRVLQPCTFKHQCTACQTPHNIHISMTLTQTLTWQ